ncbi:MAG TPA: DegQ family serine endoprotease [Kiloniellales bacterium]
MKTHKLRWSIAAIALTVGAAAFAFTTQPVQKYLGAPELPEPVAGPAPAAPSDVFVDVAKKVTPAVVTITSTRRAEPASMQGEEGQNPFEQFLPPGFRFRLPNIQRMPRQGFGSGVIVREDGVILTNNHVIDSMDEVSVRTTDGETYLAEVIGSDPKSDLAVLKIEAQELPTVPFGDSDQLQVGQWVMAVGSPFGPGLEHTVTAGIVSAKGRSNLRLAEYEDFIQTDAAINPGNSGGALVDTAGRLIGINTAIASGSGGFQGVGFAIPSNMAREIGEELLQRGRVVRGWLGIAIQDIDKRMARALGREQTGGVLVGEVSADGPAADSGLKRGDIIIQYDGQPVADMNELRNRVAGSEPGHAAELTVLRDEQERRLTVELGELPDETGEATGSSRAQEPGTIGMQLRDLTPALRGRLEYEGDGVLIAGITNNSPAQKAGLRPGDVLIEIDRQAVTSPSDVVAKLRQLQSGDTILLLVYRDGTTSFVPIEIP